MARKYELRNGRLAPRANGPGDEIDWDDNMSILAGAMAGLNYLPSDILDDMDEWGNYSAKFPWGSLTYRLMPDRKTVRLSMTGVGGEKIYDRDMKLKDRSELRQLPASHLGYNPQQYQFYIGRLNAYVPTREAPTDEKWIAAGILGREYPETQKYLRRFFTAGDTTNLLTNYSNYPDPKPGETPEQYSKRTRETLENFKKVQQMLGRQRRTMDEDGLYELGLGVHDVPSIQRNVLQNLRPEVVKRIQRELPSWIKELQDNRDNPKAFKQTVRRFINQFGLTDKQKQEMSQAVQDLVGRLLREGNQYFVATPRKQ